VSAKYDFSCLKLLRKKRSLSIQALCKKSGLAYGSVANLERNKGKPELETLSKIADALGISATNLIALAENEHVHKVGKGIKRNIAGSQLTVFDVNGLKIILGKIAKGKKIKELLNHQDDYEVCYVSKGSLKITVDNSDNVVRLGEMIKFDPSLDHIYEALDHSEFITIYQRK